MSVKRNNEIPKSLAILGTAVASGLALALVLSSAPVLGGRDSALAAGTECTGGGGGGTPSPTPTQSSGPLPGPIQTLLPGQSPTPTPSGSASATATPTGTPTTTPTSAEMPDPAATTPTPGSSTPAGTPTGSPTESPVTGPPQSTTKCGSRITLSYNGNRQSFNGSVRSDEEACERGRRVLLKRDRKNGRDRTVATTVTNRRGRYTIPLPDRQGTRFFAKTPRQAVTSGRQEIVCMGDRSRTVSTRNPL